jgi:hypothetical protein
LSKIKIKADKEKFVRLRDMEATDVQMDNSLHFLCSALEEVTGKKAIILMDEYDAPLQSAYFNGYYGQMLPRIRSMLHSALKGNDFLDFAVITGCLRVSRESIFTGLNNLVIM